MYPNKLSRPTCLNFYAAVRKSIFHKKNFLLPMISRKRKDAAAVTLAVVADGEAVCVPHHHKRRYVAQCYTQSRYRRPAFLCTFKSLSTALGEQLLPCGKSSDFLCSLNYDCLKFFDVLNPALIAQRDVVKFGSPYRERIKVYDRNPTIDSAEILCLVLYHMKSSSKMYRLSLIFGLVQTSVFVWLDYRLQVA